MKTIFLLTAIPVVMTNGCAFGIDGSGILANENRTVEVFTGIDLQCSANVFFSLGDEQSVRVEAEDNIISHITTTVKNNELIVSTDGKKFTSHQPISVYVTAKELCLLEVTGSGNMIGKSHINCDNMTLSISGSGDLNADVRSLTMKINVSGSGNIDISGTSTSTDVSIAGSGNIDAKNLQVLTSQVTITGSGKSIVNASEALTVSITGSGNVNYIGEPQKLNKSITGSGKVKKI